MLENLLHDESVSEIMVNGTSHIYFEKEGKLRKCDARFTNISDIYQFIETILQPLGRQVNIEIPYTDARLPDGSRMNVIIPPLSLTGPMVTIRKFSSRFINGNAFIESGSLSSEMLEFLALAIRLKKNIIVSGGTGSGKTTLLNFLSSFISETERIITIEDIAELRLLQEHVARLETRPPDANGALGSTIRQLLVNALRMRPDRIIIGECRGGETLDMLQAMNTGHCGSMTTVHANSPRDCLKRLETMVLMSGFDLPLRAIRDQICSAVNLIVQVCRYADGSRKITDISEITGMEGETITSSPIFECTHKGEFRATQTIPSFMDEARTKGIQFSMEMFR